MSKYFLRPAIVLILSGFVSGCEVINPEEDIPGYITIQKPTFSAGVKVTNSHEIVTGWVYVKGRLLGVYDLPATIPVLSTGETRISVNGGVIADGQRATRDMYPFYSSYHETIDIVPGQSYTITPAFTYDEGVKFQVTEDFEVSVAELEATFPYTLEGLPLIAGDSMYFANGGGTAGIVYSKPDTGSVIQIISTGEGFPLRAGRAAYLEFDMRTSLAVTVGLQYELNGAVNGPLAELTVFPSSDWKKFYVNLFNEVAEVPDQNAKFKVVFLAKPGTSGRDYIAIDNVRLVHFQ